MARLTDTVRQALGYWWSLIQGASAQGFRANEVTSMAADVAKTLGVTMSFQDAQAVAVLYGYARRMDNAAGVFQAAGPEQQISGDMIATPPWARDEAEMNAYPIWHATFSYTYLDNEGNMNTEFRTSVFRLTLPDTVGELADAIEVDAIAMSVKYDVQLVSADPISLHSV